jgi:hypothetical protein
MARIWLGRDTKKPRVMALSAVRVGAPRMRGAANYILVDLVVLDGCGGTDVRLRQ